MAVSNDQLQIKPYTSDIPTVQIPQEVIGNLPSGQPLQGQFGRKGTGALAVGDAIVKGFLQGHAEKAKRKASEAQAAISAADAAEAAAYEKYQNALTAASGNVKAPEAQAAYQAYMGVFNQKRDTMAKYTIEEKPKGGKSGGPSAGGKKGEKKEAWHGIKEFFEANPHIVPQIALATMTPKPQGLSREARLQNLQEEAAKQEVATGKAQQTAAEVQTQDLQEQHQQKQQEQKVNEAGGYEAVLKNEKADPTLRTAALRMRSEAFAKQSPLDQMKLKGLQDIQSGANKNWTPEQRMTYAALGVGAMPQQVTRTGKNGHQEMILIDPTTNQIVVGSKPLDLGPSPQAQAYGMQRALDRAEIEKAVKAAPTEYGIVLTGNDKSDHAQINARVDQLLIRHDFGISTLSDQFGRTAFETQEQNNTLSGLVKSLGLDKDPAKSKLAKDPGKLTYPDGKQTQVGPEYFAAIMKQFVDTSNGIMAFREAPANPDGKSPAVLETERKFLYQYVKSHLLTEKGKNAMTPEQADRFLERTSLGQPITTQQPQNAGNSLGQPPGYQAQSRPSNAFGPPPGYQGQQQKNWDRGTGVTDADLASQ